MICDYSHRWQKYCVFVVFEMEGTFRTWIIVSQESKPGTTLTKLRFWFPFFSCFSIINEGSR